MNYKRILVATMVFFSLLAVTTAITWTGGTTLGISGNPFDQELNTTNSVNFDNVTVSNWFNGLFNWITNSPYLSFNGSTLDFNETKLNSTITNLAGGGGGGGNTSWNESYADGLYLTLHNNKTELNNSRIYWDSGTLVIEGYE